MKRIAFAALAFVTIGCVSAGNFPQMARAEQDLFHRCTKPIEPAVCGNITDSMYEAMCVRQAMANYSAEPTAQARKVWLVARGCPPAMVEPERFMAGGAK
jgi:hypothetical protein